MADEPNATPDEAAPEGDAAKAKGGIMGLLTKLPVLIGGVMVLEAAVLFVGFKALGGGPSSADAAHVDEHGAAHVDDGHGDPHASDGHGDAHAGESADPNSLVEVAVDSFRAQNQLDGRTYLYDVEVSVQVAGSDAERVKSRLSNSKGLVRDRLTRIIRGIDPTKLNGTAEPGLETLRRQVQYQLDLIVGEGVIQEVLVPRCIPYRTSY
jgi:hypothetical protein